MYLISGTQIDFPLTKLMWTVVRMTITMLGNIGYVIRKHNGPIEDPIKMCKISARRSDTYRITSCVYINHLSVIIDGAT